MSKEIIVLLGDNGYIVKAGKGHYEVWKNGAVAATKVFTSNFPNQPEKALQLAQDKFFKL